MRGIKTFCQAAGGKLLTVHPHTFSSERRPGWMNVQELRSRQNSHPMRTLSLLLEDTSLPAAGGGVKGKRSVCRGRHEMSLRRQTKFLPGTANGIGGSPQGLTDVVERASELAVIRMDHPTSVRDQRFLTDSPRGRSHRQGRREAWGFAETDPSKQ